MTAYSEIEAERARAALDELTARRRADHDAALAEGIRERLGADTLIRYLEFEFGPRDGRLDVTVDRDDHGTWTVYVAPLGSDSWEFAGALEKLERDARHHAESVARDERRITLSREAGRLAFERRLFRDPINCDDDAESAAWLQGYDEAKRDKQERERPPVWFAIVAFTYLSTDEDDPGRRFDSLPPVFGGSRDEATSAAEQPARNIWLGSEVESGPVVDRVEVFAFDQSETSTDEAHPIARRRLAEIVAEDESGNEKPSH